MGKRKSNFTKNKRKRESTFTYETKFGEKRTFKEGDLYEVEAIRRKQESADGPKYYVKWKNWPEHSNTWEPAKNLANVRDIVLDFEYGLNKSADLTNLIDIFQKVDEENKNISDSDSDDEGSLPKDHPKKIIDIKRGPNYYNDFSDLVLLVEWEIRNKSGSQPSDSWVKSSELMKKHVKLLTKFYEKITFIFPN